MGGVAAGAGTDLQHQAPLRQHALQHLKDRPLVALARFGEAAPVLGVVGAKGPGG